MNDAFGHPQSVVVLGGTSDIALALVRRLTEARCTTVVLAGRREAPLQQAAADVGDGAGVTVQTVQFDATEPRSADTTVARCFAAARGQVDLVVVAVGELGDQEHDASDPERITQMVQVNFAWPAAAVAVAVERLQAQGHGRIVVLSSVAGYRVRHANYVYGATKAGLDGFLQGLQDSLAGSPVHVHIVRPGFVHTKMTAGLPPAPFSTSPEAVAASIVAGLERDVAVIWSPAGLRWAFGVMRTLPRRIWRRLPG
ncbi:MAG TPA: SDR family NAD(P)-dependent oxidoreductase [Acidimicrobiales bacterium]|nr:SDR family NAD(P)-dependent oxidoreductase [Acidimicrobiales bacterium]